MKRLLFVSCFSVFSIYASEDFYKPPTKPYQPPTKSYESHTSEYRPSIRPYKPSTRKYAPPVRDYKSVCKANQHRSFVCCLLNQYGKRGSNEDTKNVSPVASDHEDGEKKSDNEGNEQGDERGSGDADLSQKPLELLEAEDVHQVVSDHDANDGDHSDDGADEEKETFRETRIENDPGDPVKKDRGRIRRATRRVRRVLRGAAARRREEADCIDGQNV